MLHGNFVVLNMDNLSLSEWRKQNIADISKIKSEEDVKNHIVIPYLQYLGYTIPSMRFENSMSVKLAQKALRLNLILKSPLMKI